MAGSSFVVTPTPPTVLRLSVGDEGKFSFTITVLDAPDQTRDVTLRAMLERGGKHEEVAWLSVEPRRTMSLPGGSTEVATVVVRPTAKSPQGEHRIQLAVYDDERPHDNYTYSAPVVCEIAATAATKPAIESPRLPGWLIPAIAGAGVLGIVGILVGLLRGGGASGDELNQLSDQLRVFGDRVGKLEDQVRKLEDQVRKLDPAKPRKLCAAARIPEWRDTIEVDDSWTANDCRQWADRVEGFQVQLGCLFTTDNGTGMRFSLGEPHGAPPTPNCGWQ